MNKQKSYIGNINDFSDYGGWFIGQFIDKDKYPLLKSNEFKVAWKELPKNFTEKKHIHKKAIEVNIVISGWMEITIDGNRQKVSEKQFYIIYPNTPLSIQGTGENTKVIVIKCPSVKDDKFVEEQ